MGANFGHVYGWESSADISYFGLSKNITRLRWPARTTGGKFYLKYLRLCSPLLVYGGLI